MTDKKTNAPERIWAFHAPEVGEDNPQCSIVAGEHVMHGAQQYIRADLVPQWHRIDDPENPPPNDGKRFLAYEELDGYGLYECWYQHDFSNWCGWQDDWDSEPEPTHWMPLPTPPEPTQ